MKKFTIQPEGIIKGGTAHYDVDAATGVITYRAEVKVKLLFFTQTKIFDGQYTVDPRLLHPESFDELGETHQIGNVEFTVIRFEGDLIRLAVRVIDQDMSGFALIDELTPELIEIKQLDAKATVMGMNLVLRLREV